VKLPLVEVVINAVFLFPRVINVREINFIPCRAPPRRKSVFKLEAVVLGTTEA
jgi:hypothetical protein